MTTLGDRLQIVPATAADAAAVHAMAQELTRHGRSLPRGDADSERWSALLADERVSVLVATVDGHPVGYVSAVRTLHLWSGADVLALDEIFVRPPARGAGVGEALMRALAHHSGGSAIRWEVGEGDLRCQRCSIRLGARLRRKVVAWWPSAPGT